ncbi:MAG TPA: murein transglycosylase domain-containing protein [Candidatus Wunengus sp. YC63]|uniref:murein transglycosylase domain-containing protein n=1 Tax=Candidatus Wunengus sp. YC63 TaxID=3367699 RepID=UPI0040278A8A
MAIDHRHLIKSSRMSPSLPVLLLVCFSFITSAHAAVIQDFESSQDDNQAIMEGRNPDVTKQYQVFLEQEKRAYQEFARRAEDTWGKDNVWAPEPKVWVQYSEDFKERGAVDFEDGVARVEIVLEKEADTYPAKAEGLLTQAIERLFTGADKDPVEMVKCASLQKVNTDTLPSGSDNLSETTLYTVIQGDTLCGISRRFKVSRKAIAQLNRMSPDDWLKIGQVLVIPSGNTAPVSSQVNGYQHKTPANETNTPLLKDQLRFSDGTPVTQNNIQAFAKELLNTQKYHVTQVVGADGQMRQSVTIDFTLIPEHLRVRAEHFRPLISRYSGQYTIYPPLIYAVIHTESAFNPRARSPAPAYGLMQLVPHTGGRDAYRFVYDADGVVDADFLYNPEKNIELGVAYLHIISNRYMKHIEDQVSRLYCTIAAYNTGAGNISKAFNIGTSVKLAASIINGMSSDQVYSRLCSDLPYEETRSYLKNVCDRIPLYREWE